VSNTRHNVSLLLCFVALCATFVTAGLSAANVYAQASANQGRIAIKSASLRDSTNGWQLVASADIQLSPEMRQGLNSGVPLQFIVDLRIKRTRNFWLDDTLLEYQHRYSLIYYELTRHYRLQSLDSGESGNYRSLTAALEQLSELQGLIAPKPVKMNNNARLYGQLSLRLDDKALPLPLQPLLSSDWKLASEDFAWPLN